MLLSPRFSTNQLQGLPPLGTQADALGLNQDELRAYEHGYGLPLPAVGRGARAAERSVERIVERRKALVVRIGGQWL